MIKKGFINGRGYVVNDKKGVTVIGGANIDIKGMTFDTLKKYTSNPGHVEITLGGVGRNIANNLALLDVPVTFLSIIGNDDEGKRIITETRKTGVNCEHITTSDTKHTGIYLAIIDNTGNMDIAISGMEVLEELNVKYLEKKIDIINNSRIVVIDTNIPESSIEYVVDACARKNIPVLAEPVSIDKSKKLKKVLGNIDYITPNRDELGSLLETEIINDNDMIKVTKEIRKLGTKNVIVTLGERGVYLSSNEYEGYVDSYKVNVIDATGAGDALTAGFIYGIINDMSIEDSVRYGIAAATFTLSSSESVNPFLNRKILDRIVKENKYV
nr:carbohydrate kinase family protein [Thermoanaerobacterium thermosaccharolyticum]